MKKLALLIFLAAAFLAGYHFGHRPESPDLTAPILRAARWVADETGRAIDAARPTEAEAGEPPSIAPGPRARQDRP